MGWGASAHKLEFSVGAHPLSMGPPVVCSDEVLPARPSLTPGQAQAETPRLREPAAALRAPLCPAVGCLHTSLGGYLCWAPPALPYRARDWAPRARQARENAQTEQGVLLVTGARACRCLSRRTSVTPCPLETPLELLQDAERHPVWSSLAMLGCV